jgi:hypothetical protein
MQSSPHWTSLAGHWQTPAKQSVPAQQSQSSAHGAPGGRQHQV